MRKSLDLWRFVEKRLASQEDVVLMVVAESSGSSPGRPGFKMAVAADDICGSIGGGVMEVALVERAKQELRGVDKFDRGAIRQVHRKNSRHPSGMICSGEQTVIIRRLGPKNLEVARRCLRALELGTETALRITHDEISTESGESHRGISFNAESEVRYEYIERLGVFNELVIVGGGHCALALSELMSRLGFRISIYDDRPGLSTIEKNEFAHSVHIIEDYSSIGTEIKSGQDRYVVVMTIGFKYDKIVIRELIDKRFRYLGVLGSKAKMAILMRELHDEGLDPEKLARIHTPIGIQIGSRTPEEIAVSIAAQIISVKNEENK